MDVISLKQIEAVECVLCICAPILKWSMISETLFAYKKSFFPFSFEKIVRFHYDDELMSPISIHTLKHIVFVLILLLRAHQSLTTC